MKKILILLAIFNTFAATAQSVGINTDGSAANASAILDVKSTTKGFLIPRMTESQRNAIASPIATGLRVWCTDCGTSGETQVYNGTTWTNMIGGVVTMPLITIGTQVWTLKNLDVATYTDGTVIPEVTSGTDWLNLTTGAWRYNVNDPANGAIYGKLYNWYAVAGIWNEASRTDTSLRKKLAPAGYHVPTEEEWTILTDYLGGETVAGGKMKTTGTLLWLSPNTDATNESGFSGIPGGFQYNNYALNYIGEYGVWWSSSEFSTTHAWYRDLRYNSGRAFRNYYYKKTGYSVRCLRD
jgi:uncharacterized protein (TIGR02145 family)